MALTVNTNIMSLNAQRNLSKSEGMLGQSLERLSSGLRINSAKDDAAGLAIAERFVTQIRGLNQAVRNANDGISLSQTSESALNEVVSNLQRIRELAVQSANATNSSDDRLALDAEVQQRLAEIDRIATQTTFNGRRVLDGSFGDAQFQVGANVGETITVSLNTGVRSNQIGQIATGTGSVTTANLTEGGVTIAVGTGTAASVSAAVAGNENGQDIDSAFAKAEAINAAGVSGLTATATNTEEVAFATVDSAGYNLTVNDVAIYTGHDGTTEALNLATVIDQINLSADQTGVRASANGSNLVLTAADGRNINVDETTTTDIGLGALVSGTAGFAFTGATGSNGTPVSGFGTISLSASDTIDLQGADVAALGFTAGAIAVDATTIDSLAITDVSTAEDAILRVDSALTSVSALRSDLGAIQNRFESTINNLSTIVENLEASRSRIQDADFAAETAALTKAQILQQAGVAILSQANATPQAVLGLLQ